MGIKILRERRWLAFAALIMAAVAIALQWQLLAPVVCFIRDVRLDWENTGLHVLLLQIDAGEFVATESVKVSRPLDAEITFSFLVPLENPATGIECSLRANGELLANLESTAIHDDEHRIGATRFGVDAMWIRAKFTGLRSGPVECARLIVRCSGRGSVIPLIIDS